MDNVIKLLAFDLLAGLGALAFVVWGRATFPALAASADALAQKTSASKGFAVGLAHVVVLVLVFKLIDAVAPALPPLRILAPILVAAAAVMAFRGAVALWPDYGRRVLADDAAPDLLATLTGGALLAGILLLFPAGPVFLAYVALRSLGNGMLQLTAPKTPA